MDIILLKNYKGILQQVSRKTDNYFSLVIPVLEILSEREEVGILWNEVPIN